MKIMQSTPMILLLLLMQACASSSHNCQQALAIDSVLIRSRSVIDRLKISRSSSDFLKKLEGNEEFLLLEKELNQGLNSIIENNEKIKTIFDPRYKSHSMTFLECDKEIKKQSESPVIIGYVY